MVAQAGTDRRLVGDAVKPQSDALGLVSVQHDSPEGAKQIVTRPLCPCFALSGLVLVVAHDPGRRSAANAASLCPRLTCGCPYRGERCV